MGKLYLAYGSNMNFKEMMKRCPNAQLIGPAIIENWKLVFRGKDGFAYATIEPSDNSFVPALLWEIGKNDEDALDKYEDYPYLYRKEIIEAICEDKSINAMTYIMNPGYDIGKPSKRYYNIIKQGYIDAGFDVELIENILRN
ncbi:MULTISPECIES: gamma-glutamylcyclotransferase family protein [Thermoanaerobacterium]|uniref:AIG2 family protein n=2 Tax=Thermoanaerobacterium TaxID=28895 RepID=W9EA57_9THEO|nr:MULTISPECIES: gamma-glutamylcyclotransferase family protein [Thermoanaerobacterium]AFK87096.1 AIG2 family protein [Thermoanaerobacterium saccharolyticum JW/SL-YS485]ETO38878.1 AIG2 family protein [Thermoanaerobacterium aotearoense SCUT27]